MAYDMNTNTILYFSFAAECVDVDIERTLSNDEKLVDIFARWGPYRDQVRFYLRQSKLEQRLRMFP